MLKVDLGQVERDWKVSIDEQIPADAEIWTDSGISLAEPLTVTGEAQKAALDVLVRGRFSGVLAMECRRCLQPVRVPVEEEFTLLFRPGLKPEEAPDADAYPLPERGRELDLADALREHVLLAVPRFAICEETCRGLCPHCGTNLNDSSCDCTVEEKDPRWDALRNVKLD
jgi:uncharacterized protein